MYLPSLSSATHLLAAAASTTLSTSLLPRTAHHPPTAACHKWTLAGASPTAAYSIYNIKHFTPHSAHSAHPTNSDTEARLRRELSNCVISDYRFGVDPWNEGALFVTFVRPDYDRGCVERAVVRAGGPQLMGGSGDEGDPGCVFHALPDTMGKLRKWVVPFNAGGRVDQGVVQMGFGGDGKTEDGLHWLKTGRPIWISCTTRFEGVTEECHEGGG